jgi:ZIP family zinc transporter
MGRVNVVGTRAKAFFTATATGILVFLLWDVLKEGIEPVENALTAASRTHSGSWWHFAGLSSLALGGFAVGLLSLVYYDAFMKRRRSRGLLGPGAASVAEFQRSVTTGLSPAAWLAVLIATGIGLHNFSEGLAIGQSAASDKLSLAVVLVIGFGLHNATEGLGIVAPLAGEREPPSWRFLGTLGLIGGAPTFLGTAVGQAWTSEALSVCFLTLAAGSILFVVIELLGVCRALGSKNVTAWGILLGVVLGFATDFILVGAGV